jgi:hypothetical protein
VRELLLSQSYSKLRGPGSEKNIRALANLVSRFFEPIMKELQVTTTEDILLSQHSAYLFRSLVSFGGIEEFFDNPESYIDALKTKKVRFHLIVCILAYLTFVIIFVQTERRVKGPKHSDAQPGPESNDHL